MPSTVTILQPHLPVELRRLFTEGFGVIARAGAEDVLCTLRSFAVAEGALDADALKHARRLHLELARESSRAALAGGFHGAEDARMRQLSMQPVFLTCAKTFASVLAGLLVPENDMLLRDLRSADPALACKVLDVDESKATKMRPLANIFQTAIAF